MGQDNSQISEEQFSREIKKIIRTYAFFKILFERFDIPIDRIDDNLQFHISDLRGIYAQGDAENIYVNRRLIDGGNFFKEGIHFIVHELVHWLVKQKQKDLYFADPEEVDAFSYGMMFEILRGKPKKHIARIFFPIIEAHFKDKQNAKSVFELLYANATKKANNYLGNESIPKKAYGEYLIKYASSQEDALQVKEVDHDVWDGTLRLSINGKIYTYQIKWPYNLQTVIADIKKRRGTALSKYVRWLDQFIAKKPTVNEKKPDQFDVKLPEQLRLFESKMNWYQKIKMAKSLDPDIVVGPGFLWFITIQGQFFKTPTQTVDDYDNTLHTEWDEYLSRENYVIAQGRYSSKVNATTMSIEPERYLIERFGQRGSRARGIVERILRHEFHGAGIIEIG